MSDAATLALLADRYYRWSAAGKLQSGLDRAACVVTTRVLFLAPCLLLTASPAVAQVLRGTVMDTTSARPVDGARVAALSTAGVRIADAVTKTDGKFTFHLPTAGDYRLHASRPGYATTITETIGIDSGSEASFVIPMVRRPLPLDTVTVVARPLPAQQQVPHLVDAGFYHRQRMGFGYFLTRGDIDNRAALVIGDLLRGIPGIQVHCRNPLQCHVTMPGANTMFIGSDKACSPSVVLDGLLLSVGGSNNSAGFGALRPFNLEAVEIYTHSNGVPVQWRTSACGAIVAWSRR